MAWSRNATMSLNLITFVVSIRTAVKKEDEVSAHAVCDGAGSKDGKTHVLTRCKAPLTCPQCNADDRTKFLKAVDTDSGLKLLDNTERAGAQASADIETMKKQVALGLHDAAEVSTKTMPGGGAYYLHPKAGADAYYAIVEVLRKHPEKVLLCQWVPVSRANLYQIKVFGDTLVMLEQARTEDIQVEQLPVTAPKPTDVAMLEAFLDNLTTPFDPATYADQYTANLRKVLADKDAVTVEGSKATKAKGSLAPVVDLTSTLEALLAAQKAAPKKPARKRAERKSA